MNVKQLLDGLIYYQHNNNYPYSFSIGTTPEQNEMEISNVDDFYNLFIFKDDNVPTLTLTELETNANNASVSESRKNEYPTIQDQLDMQYWDNVNGTTTWKDAIEKVKADNPKPE
tara:strand:- start:30 stop:374 length:345 start_codon:yes stop_codon:yes gene_type:complete